METDPTKILRFISHFAGAQEVFLNGMCFWFAYILSGRFGGTTMYDQIPGHFVQEIGGRLYDVTGDVTEEHISSRGLMKWPDIKTFDPSLYKTLIRDCVKKER